MGFHNIVLLKFRNLMLDPTSLIVSAKQEKENLPQIPTKKIMNGKKKKKKGNYSKWVEKVKLNYLERKILAFRLEVSCLLLVLFVF